MPTTIVKNLRDGTLTIADGGSETLEVSFIGDDGLSWTEKLNYIVQRNRGVLAGRRSGDEDEVELTFSIQYVMYQSEETDSEPTVMDALKCAGLADEWVSTGDAGEPYSVTLTFAVLAPEKGTSETFEFTKFVPSQFSFKEGADGSAIEITGTAHLTKPDVSWE